MIYASTKKIHRGLLALGAASLMLVATPELLEAKERRSAEQTRPNHGATSTRPSTSTSSRPAPSGRTRAGNSGSSRSSHGSASGGQSGRHSTHGDRQAVPRDRGSYRSGTPSHSRSSHRHGYSHRGHGYSGSHYYGSHYRYSYFPYYGWGYASDWYYPDLYWSRYYRPFWGGWWGSYWDWFFYTGYTPARERTRRAYVSRSGALDLDVSPEEAEVWIDGEYLGTADDYDGFPEYLWLPSGPTTVVYYLHGYETLTRDYDLRPGQVIRVRDEMRRGESIHPEDLYRPSDSGIDRGHQPKPYSGASSYREDREIRNSERRGEAERRRAAEESWRERETSASSDGRVGRLFLTVEPDDASVYLDGIFLGLARELSQLSAGLVVAPGEHRLEVVRPGYEDEARDFDLDADDSLEIELELDRD